MPYKNITPPAGDKISTSQGKLNVPRPSGHSIYSWRWDRTRYLGGERARLRCRSRESLRRKKKISWFEVFAGQAAKDKFDEWLPDDTVEAFREYLVGIKGPLTTPVGGGIRSLNVALRQLLDLFVCLRPVQYFSGVPSPVKHPEKVNMVSSAKTRKTFTPGSNTPAAAEDRKRSSSSSQKEFPKEFDKDSLRHERKGGGVLETSRRAGKGRRPGRHRHQTG